ncbi:hypothetical protein LB566_14300 [Mesorhizobium sp. CA13]|uniref:hypothetical protein n=1 Tax=Mesorhizobium sp. CA13 TaxID=2876643 RepID=UPI001CCAAA1E|nr:hypothetical protein [Mesorhizobium sp. CA13]MBZ9854978.1 hypothetical protein [Mesorhizobium sp. CA13]
MAGRETKKRPAADQGRRSIAPMEYNELRYIGWYLEEISRASGPAPALRVILR